MVTHIIQAGRADVVIREDVIESTSDPKPNSFFDSKTGILRVYHGPKYGNPFVSLIPAKAEQIGTMISQLNQSAAECKSESSINLERKNNDNIPSTETEMEKKEIASSNKNISRDGGGNDSLLNFSTQRPQTSEIHDEVQDDKYIRECLKTSSIATAHTVINDPGYANEILKKNFPSNKDDGHNNNDDNNEFIDQFVELQSPLETTDDKNDGWKEPIFNESIFNESIPIRSNRKKYKKKQLSS